MSNAPLQKWTRQGLICDGQGFLPGESHASHPVYYRNRFGQFILFAVRNAQSQSRVYRVKVTCLSGELCVVGDAPEFVLDLGPVGAFDSDGVLPCAAVPTATGDVYLYYSGWNNLGDGVWLCDTGLAVISGTDNSVSRMFAGPIVSRRREHPYFVAMTTVLHMEPSKWLSWFNSGLTWFRDASSGELKCHYGIHAATSKDGIDWDLGLSPVIPFSDDLEHSFGRPTVIVDNGFHMWFSHRGDRGNSNYRIGYAFSVDGVRWSREDAAFNLAPTGRNGDFDEHAMAYPFVFSQGSHKFMLYCGDGYGKTGFGYAVSEA